MDSVQLSASSRAIDGLRLMMEAAGDLDAFVQTYVDVSVALLIVEVAKLAPDNDEWFPYGKWATIQSIQGRIAQQLKTLQSAAKDTPI